MVGTGQAGLSFREVGRLIGQRNCFTKPRKGSTVDAPEEPAAKERYTQMRKYLTLTMALGALIALSVVGFASAAGEKPSEVVVGNLKLIANGGFSPKALSKTTPTPISLTASGEIQTLDGSQPPAVKEVILETDKNGSVNVKGYPTCKSSQLQATDTATAEKTCKTALIGTGTTTARVQFPEQNPINVPSKLLVFNGGESGGTTTMYIHAYFSAPVSGAIVTTVKIKKIHKGRFGLLATASIPKIANGAGSVTKFNLTINKKFTYKGKKQSILAAKCTDGKLQVHVLAKFYSGEQAATEIVRTCTPKK